MTETAVLTKLCDTADVSKDLPVRAEIEGFGCAIFQAGDQYYVPLICAHTGRVICRMAPGRSASSGGLPVESTPHMRRRSYHAGASKVRTISADYRL